MSFACVNARGTVAVDLCGAASANVLDGCSHPFRAHVYSDDQGRPESGDNVSPECTAHTCMT